MVLGFANRGPRINVVNRWRARIAVRTARKAERLGASVEIVCSGGAVRGSVPEAILLRRYIIRRLGWHGPVHVESDSTSTWEKVRNTFADTDRADWVAFASNGLHAEKARTYLLRQRPERSGVVVGADEYRFGEAILLKPVFAAVGLVKLQRAFHVEHRDDCVRWVLNPSAALPSAELPTAARRP